MTYGGNEVPGSQSNDLGQPYWNDCNKEVAN